MCLSYVPVDMGSGCIKGEPCGLKPRQPVSLNCTGPLGLFSSLGVGRSQQTCRRFTFPLTKLGLEARDLILFSFLFLRNNILQHVCTLVLSTKVHLTSRKDCSKFSQNIFLDLFITIFSPYSPHPLLFCMLPVPLMHNSLSHICTSYTPFKRYLLSKAFQLLRNNCLQAFLFTLLL